MLNRLSIRNIVTIDKADIAFADGLCVLTGETGAGKSILLDALGLALGARADQRLLRAGTDEASVTAQFTLTPVAASILKELGLDSDDDQLFLRRHLAADGKSRAFINDQPVSISGLKQLGETLLEIHGQHDQRQLAEPAYHRDLLDRFGNHTALRRDLADAYDRWQHAAQALEELRQQLAEALREQDYLRHVADELSQLAPQSGEAEQLQDRRRELMQAEKLALTLQEVGQAFASDQSPRSQIYAIERALARAHASLQEALEPVQAELSRAQDAVASAEQQLNSLQQQFDYSPQELEQTESRLFALNAAARKHQVTPEELPGLLESVRASLQTLDAQESSQQQLETDLAKHRTAYLVLAETLHEKRQAAAKKLEKALSAELKPLKMQNCQSMLQFSQLPEAQWQTHGHYRVQLEVSTNAGSSFGPLQQVASGGELSRFMLALKSIIAANDDARVMIFDEIDTGTGGAVADAIGSRLHSLAARHQILVVTHLPQVAARASHHLFIEKETKAGQTTTRVSELNKSQHEEELARMLSGADITDEARLAARKLVESAA
jgi:DNA repair protein RecN (Recombination protein N)